jgi:hypothetical protein
MFLLQDGIFIRFLSPDLRLSAGIKPESSYENGTADFFFHCRKIRDQIENLKNDY